MHSVDNATSYPLPEAITLAGTGLDSLVSLSVGNNFVNSTWTIAGTGGMELQAGGAASNHYHLFTLSSALTYTGATQFETDAASGRVFLSGTTLPAATVVTMEAGAINGTNTLQFDLSAATARHSRACKTPPSTAAPPRWSSARSLPTATC